VITFSVPAIRHAFRPALTLVVIALASAACSPSGAAATPGGDPARDKLAQVLARGTLVGYAELDYPPQSIRLEGVPRAAETACLSNQITGVEISGFDVEVTKLVANELGVEPCFVQPTFSEVTAGNWGDRLDIAYASGSINADRMTRLYMTQPYYAVPNHYFVRADAAFESATDLAGRRIGACVGCSHEAFLRGELRIPGVEVALDVSEPVIVGFETEGPGLQAVADGEIDAFLAAAPVGLARIEEDLPLRLLEPAAFTYYPTGFVDRSSGLDADAFLTRVNEIIGAAHADGTLLAMSREWFGTDYTTAAAAFDLDAIGQTIP